MHRDCFLCLVQIRKPSGLLEFISVVEIVDCLMHDEVSTFVSQQAIHIVYCFGVDKLSLAATFDASVKRFCIRKMR